MIKGYNHILFNRHKMNFSFLCVNIASKIEKIKTIIFPNLFIY